MKKEDKPMKFYEFGDSSNPSIMYLPGNFMTHRQF